MKIGFFTDSYWPVRHGVQASIDSFADKLEEMGHEVHIYTTHSPKYEDKRSRVVRLKSLKFIKNPEMRIAMPFVHNGDIASLVKQKLDIVHAHTPFGLGVLGKIISKYQKIPMVYTHHTDYVEYSKFYLKDKVLLPRMAKKVTAWFANGADMVIAPSEKIRKTLVDYGTNSEIFVLPTGINMLDFKRTRASATETNKLRKRLSIEPKEKVALFFGRIGGEKNIDFIIKSFARLNKSNPDTKLVIAGDGPYLKNLKKLAKSLKLEEEIIFPGFIEEEEKKLFFQMADVFVFASHTDTQGIVILEASASGLPVVVLKDDAFAGMVINGVNGFDVTSNSEEIFARKIDEILNNKALATKMSENSIKIAALYSEDEQTKKLEAIYQGLIKNK